MCFSGLCRRCVRKNDGKVKKDVKALDEDKRNPQIGKYTLGAKEPMYVLFWKQVTAEFIAAFIYTMCNLLIYMQMNSHRVSSSGVYEMGFSNSFVLAGLVMALGPLSGGYCTPAVDVGMWLAARISFVKFIFYVLVHIIGSYAGGYMVWFFLKDIRFFDTEDYGRVAMKKENLFLINRDGHDGAAMKVEAMMTFALVLVYAGCEDLSTKYKDRINSAAHTAIGVFSCVCACHFTCLSISGSGMNPAAVYISAYLGDSYKNFWMYWAGPVLGAIVAGFVHKNGLSLYKSEQLKLGLKL